MRRTKGKDKMPYRKHMATYRVIPECATFAYARYVSRQRAEAALEDMFAEGTVSPCEFSHIAKVGGMWNIFLKIS
jgi:hypothetical protein